MEMRRDMRGVDVDTFAPVLPELSNEAPVFDIDAEQELLAPRVEEAFGEMWASYEGRTCSCDSNSLRSCNVCDPDMERFVVGQTATVLDDRETEQAGGVSLWTEDDAASFRLQLAMEQNRESVWRAARCDVTQGADVYILQSEMACRVNADAEPTVDVDHPPEVRELVQNSRLVFARQWVQFDIPDRPPPAWQDDVDVPTRMRKCIRMEEHCATLPFGAFSLVYARKLSALPKVEVESMSAAQLLFLEEDSSRDDGSAPKSKSLWQCEEKAALLEALESVRQTLGVDDVLALRRVAHHSLFSRVRETLGRTHRGRALLHKRAGSKKNHKPIREQLQRLFSGKM